MPKYKVSGVAQVEVIIEVEADDSEDAFDVADQKFGGIVSYAGNGGVNKLIGVAGTNESISCYNEVEWTETI